MFYNDTFLHVETLLVFKMTVYPCIFRIIVCTVALNDYCDDPKVPSFVSFFADVQLITAIVVFRKHSYE